MTEPRDQELEDHLAGKSEVSRRYRQMPADAPSPALDAKIRAAARRGLGSRRPRWMMPLSAAAVIMLSVGVLMQMQQEGVAPLSLESQVVSPLPVESAPTDAAPKMGTTDSAVTSPAPGAQTPAAESRSLKSQDAVAEPFATAPVPQKRQQESADEAAPHREQSESLTTVPSATGEASSEAQREPQDWIEHIRRLREAGRNDEAARELEAFRKQYPDYPLPADLR